MGDYGRPCPSFEQAPRPDEEAPLTENHPSYATSLHNLAMVYHNMGDYAKALPLYEQARGPLEEAFHREPSPLRPSGLNSLALLYQDMGDYAKALPLLEQAPRPFEEAPHREPSPLRPKPQQPGHAVPGHGGLRQGPAPLRAGPRPCKEAPPTENHPRYADCLNNLAGLYQAMGAYEQALPLYQRTLKIIEKSLGPEHPHAVVTISNLGSRYLARKHDPAAEAHLPPEPIHRRPGGLDLARGQPGKALKLLQEKTPTWRDVPPNRCSTIPSGAWPWRGKGGWGRRPWTCGKQWRGGGPAPPGAGGTGRVLPGRYLRRLCAALPGAGERARGDVPETGGPAAGAPGVRTRGRSRGLLLCRKHQGRALLEAMAQGPGSKAARKFRRNCASRRKVC